MRDTTRNYVRSCTECTRFNAHRMKKRGHLQQELSPEGVFDILQINFWKAPARSSNDNQYVLIVTDRLSKFVFARAFPSATAKNTADMLFEDIVLKHGSIRCIRSDQGTHFKNDLLSAITDLIGCKQIISIPHHPMSNGQVERFNSTFCDQLKKYCHQTLDEWDTYLQSVVWAYNSSVHSITKFIPYELAFARCPVSPLYPAASTSTMEQPTVIGRKRIYLEYRRFAWLGHTSNNSKCWWRNDTIVIVAVWFKILVILSEQGFYLVGQNLMLGSMDPSSLSNGWTISNIDCNTPLRAIFEKNTSTIVFLSMDVIEFLWNLVFVNSSSAVFFINHRCELNVLTALLRSSDTPWQAQSFSRSWTNILTYLKQSLLVAIDCFLSFPERSSVENELLTNNRFLLMCTKQVTSDDKWCRFIGLWWHSLFFLLSSKLVNNYSCVFYFCLVHYSSFLVFLLLFLSLGFFLIFLVFFLCDVLVDEQIERSSVVRKEMLGN